MEASSKQIAEAIQEYLNSKKFMIRLCPRNTFGDIIVTMSNNKANGKEKTDEIKSFCHYVFHRDVPVGSAFRCASIFWLKGKSIIKQEESSMDTLDGIRFEVNVDMIEKYIERFTPYLNEREEDNFDYPCIYQAIVANAKANEADPLIEVKPHKHHVRQNKYDRNKAYKAKANLTRKYADAKKRKSEHDNEMIYISTGFSAPWGNYTKETVIHDSKLWKPFRNYKGTDNS